MSLCSLSSPAKPCTAAYTTRARLHQEREEGRRRERRKKKREEGRRRGGKKKKKKQRGREKKRGRKKKKKRGREKKKQSCEKASPEEEIGFVGEERGWTEEELRKKKNTCRYVTGGSHRTRGAAVARWWRKLFLASPYGGARRRWGFQAVAGQRDLICFDQRGSVSSEKREEGRKKSCGKKNKHVSLCDWWVAHDTWCGCRTASQLRRSPETPRITSIRLQKVPLRTCLASPATGIFAFPVKLKLLEVWELF
ncbi:hypothetical protein ACLB2K_000295 [Fragaria x ananassa]